MQADGNCVNACFRKKLYKKNDSYKLESMKEKLYVLHSYLLLGIIIAFFFNSCCKEKDLSLPDETTVGANKFGCYVDDELFVYSGSGGVFGAPNIGAYCDPSSNTLVIFAYTKSNDYMCLVDSIFEVGNRYIVSDAYYNDYKTKVTYKLEKDIHSEMYLSKYDVNNKIASGTFSFMVKHPVSGETKTISEGRFDVKIFDLGQ